MEQENCGPGPGPGWSGRHASGHTVNGKTYRYASRQTVSGKRELGRQVVGYYDPTRPDRITENKPRKPVLGGMCFFMFAAFLLWFGIMSFAGMLSIS